MKTGKDSNRRGKKERRNERLGELVRRNGKEVLESDNHKNTSQHIQHGTMTVRRHTIDVARTSLLISRKLRIKCNEKDLVRGALLHDYFLYDWHDKQHASPHKLHGFNHPEIALKNAEMEYELSDREKDIIKKHMWPLTIIPPMCREAWIVTLADKYCSLRETFHITGKGKRDNPEQKEDAFQ